MEDGRTLQIMLESLNVMMLSYIRRRSSRTRWSSPWLGFVHPQHCHMCWRSSWQHSSSTHCSRTKHTYTCHDRMHSLHCSTPSSCSRSYNTEFSAQGRQWSLQSRCITNFLGLFFACCTRRKQMYHRKRASELGLVVQRTRPRPSRPWALWSPPWILIKLWLVRQPVLRDIIRTFRSKV